MNITGTSSAVLLSAPAAGDSTIAVVLQSLVAASANITSGSVFLNTNATAAVATLPGNWRRLSGSRVLPAQQPQSIAELCGTPGDAAQLLSVDADVLLPSYYFDDARSAEKVLAIAQGLQERTLRRFREIMLTRSSSAAAELVAAVESCTGIKPVITAGAFAPPLIYMLPTTPPSTGLSPGTLAGVIVSSLILGLGLICAGAYLFAGRRRGLHREQDVGSLKRAAAPTSDLVGAGVVVAGAAVSKDLMLREAQAPALVSVSATVTSSSTEC